MLTRHARKGEEPVADPRLASLLEAAGAPAEPGPAPGEAAALAAFRSSTVRAHRRSRMKTPTTPLKSLSVLAASAGLLLTGGIAAANAGVLPGAAQDAARDALVRVGVDVPGANEHSAGHADTRGSSEGAVPDSQGADGPGSLPDAAGFGQMISELAKSTEAGPEKGKAISEAAKTNGHAGEHGLTPTTEHPAAGGDQGPAPSAEAQAPAPAPAPAAQGSGGQSADHAPVATPNDGGTGTADDASADNADTASTHGTDKAGAASGGRSTAGSGNKP